ncbi:unnamed protein product [Thelazia callipaeda]|uniref:Uncharacterized protein n=1 Tax=Thelazia callipaeda TaxID=103827 RepID=A0A0N5CQI6_THECL|nr:unnamed protein product [Thelazia callipaeda]
MIEYAIETQLIDASGFVAFALKEFRLGKFLEQATCCVDNNVNKDCLCEIYVHICIGVVSEHRNKYHRDCSLLHHNSKIIAHTQLRNYYNVSIPFDVRWPTQIKMLEIFSPSLNSDLLSLMQLIVFEYLIPFDNN